MHHFLIMYAPILVVVLSLITVFVWGGRQKTFN